MSAQFDVSALGDWYAKLQVFRVPLERSRENPIPILDALKVAVFDPSTGFGRVAMADPAPEHPEDFMIDFGKRLFAHDVSMVKRPSAHDGIEA